MNKVMKVGISVYTRERFHLLADSDEEQILLCVWVFLGRGHSEDELQDR